MLEHINVTVLNYAEMINFLSNVLPDMRLLREGTISDSGAKWFHVGNEQQYIAIQTPVFEREKPRKNYNEEGINHLGFRVESVDEIRRRAENYGARLRFDVIEDGPRKRLYVFDRAGFEYEFVEYSSN